MTDPVPAPNSANLPPPGRQRPSISAEELQVLLHQYNALRAEIMHLMVSRNTVLGFTFTALTVLSAGAFQILTSSLPEQNKLVVLIPLFALIFPIISLFGLDFWTSETLRIFRIAIYIHCFIEARLKHFGIHGLSWEEMNLRPFVSQAKIQQRFRQVGIANPEALTPGLARYAAIFLDIREKRVQDLNLIRAIFLIIAALAVGVALLLTGRLIEIQPTGLDWFFQLLVSIFLVDLGLIVWGIRIWRKYADSMKAMKEVA